MDFDDLLVLWLKLLQTNEEIRDLYQRKFQFLLVDEYQDTNRAQYHLVNLLAAKHRNLFVVGDDDQCVYVWRGADIRNILEFERDFGETRTIPLEQNYRSTNTILRAANAIIAHNRERKEKNLWSELGEGEAAMSAMITMPRRISRAAARSRRRLAEERLRGPGAAALPQLQPHVLRGLDLGDGERPTLRGRLPRSLHTSPSWATESDGSSQVVGEEQAVTGAQLEVRHLDPDVAVVRGDGRGGRAGRRRRALARLRRALHGGSRARPRLAADTQRTIPRLRRNRGMRRRGLVHGGQRKSSQFPA